MADDTTKTTIHTGGCLCGAVRYTLTSEPAMPMVCHCKHCQRQSGSAFSTIVAVPKSDCSVSGDVSSYIDTADSGNMITRQFCGRCGSPLFTLSDTMPGMIFVKAGTLDDTDAYTPQVHIWAKSKQGWVETGEVPALEGNPG